MAKKGFEVKVDLQNLDKMILNLNNIDKVVGRVGEKVRLHLIESWLDGKGGNERPLKRLSKKYRELKQKLTGRGEADMNFGFENRGGRYVKTPNMINALMVIRAGRNAVTVGINDLNQKRKLESNFQKRPNIMRLSKKFKDDMIAYAEKEIAK